MQCYSHVASRTVYVTTRKIASRAIETAEFLEPVFIDRKHIDVWKDWQFVVITRDPTDRFLAMYGFLMEIYHDTDLAWDSDHIYRSSLPWPIYEKFFRKNSSSWRSFTATRDFVEQALPLLSTTRDLHWRSQWDRLLQVGVDTRPYIKLPMQHVSQWFWRRHGVRVNRVNHNPWKFEGSPGTFRRLLDPYVRASVWKRDFELHGS